MDSEVEKLDQLPISRWHWETFFLIGFALQFNGFLNSSGNPITADLISVGWSNNYLNAMFSSAMMLGFFIGSLLGGILGDKIGRKKAYEINVLDFAIFSFIAAFSPNIYFLIACRCLMGIGMGAGIVLGYGTFTEFMPANVRGKWSARLSFLGNLSPIIATVTCWLVIPHFGWRAVFIIGSLLSFIILFFIHRYMCESPRWYFANGQTAAGKKTIENIVERVEHEKGKEITFTLTKEPDEEENDNLHFIDFFKGQLGRRMLVSSATLIAMDLSLYTITVWVPTIFVNNGINITKSLFMTMMVMLGAPLGVLFSTFIMDKFPRKWLGVSLIVIIAILGYVYSIQRTDVGIICVGIVLTFILYIYNSFSSAVYGPEVWPTKIKMRGFGYADGIGRIVAIVQPYLIAWLLSTFGQTAVFIVIGILLLLCGLIIAIFGIETRDKSVEEISIILDKP